MDNSESDFSELFMIAQRLETLAVKWVDTGHHDWPEIKTLCSRLDKLKPRFKETWCSQCGKEFGPGNHGYSHCENHSSLMGSFYWGRIKINRLEQILDNTSRGNITRERTF